MAPLPPPIPEKPRPPPTLPALHLRVHNLTSTGSSRFFSHTSSPGYILASSSHKVLAQLYPPSLPSILQSSSPPVRSITLFLRPFDGVAHTNGSELDNEHKEVHLSTEYLEKIGGDSKRIRDEIEGVVVHELVHVYQYNGNGTAPGGVIEGIADWVRLQEGLGPPHWKVGGGNRWDQGYDVTAFFLDYLSQTLQLPLLVPVLNSALKSREWENGALLKEILGGKDVDELWKLYKSHFEEVESRSKGLVFQEGQYQRPGGNVGVDGYDVQYVSR